MAANPGSATSGSPPGPGPLSSTNILHSPDWEGYMRDLAKAEREHDEYLHVHREMSRQQEAGTKAQKHLKYCFKQFRRDIQTLEHRQKRDKVQLTAEEREKLAAIKAQMADASVKLDDMERDLPATNNGIYLSIILGSNLNISLLNPDERYRYKQDYESFKMIVTYIILVLFLVAYMFPFRAMDALCNFLLVWYYCTLTIRESILRVNGSRIKGWWMFHHYVSLVICGITLTWKDGQCYKEFRPLMLILVFYVGSVQLLQTNYQKGCLRRLHALGQRPSMMDITVEGFSGWMFKGLTFLLPFLIGGYVIQGYCSYFLFDLWWRVDCGADWQVLWLAFLFGSITAGNVVTTLMVVLRKIFHDPDTTHLLTKYKDKTL